jgi:long-chain fatty acid transport protein
VEAEFEYNALGVTPIIGFDVRPIENLTIGLRYEFETSLEFEYEEKNLKGSSSNPAYTSYVNGGVSTLLTSAGMKDGEKVNMNLPHIIAAGVEYVVIPGLTLDLSGTVYLLPYADIDFVSSGEKKSADDYFNVGYDVGIGAKWQILDALTIGAGFSYTESGTKDSYFKEQVLNATANPPLDSIAFGLGGSYSFGFGLDLNLGVLYAHYLPVDYKVETTGLSVEGTNKKDVINIGLGVSYHY